MNEIKSKASDHQSSKRTDLRALPKSPFHIPRQIRDRHSVMVDRPQAPFIVVTFAAVGFVITLIILLAVLIYTLRAG